jgi:RNA polymerase I-specific transcription initiation factor RRN3
VIVGQEAPETSGLSDMDDSDDDVGDDFSDLSSEAGDLEEEAASELPTNVRHIREMVQKLDSILTLVFEHFKRTSTNSSAGGCQMTARSTPELVALPPLPSLPSDYPPSSPLIPTSTPPPPGEGHEFTPTPEPSTVSPSQNHNSLSIMRIQFNALLSIFDRVILRTFKSRYTQFLIFWYTSLDPEFADIFQGMLVERALLGTSPTTIQVHSEPLDGEGSISSDALAGSGSIVARAAAASYIGSFVSRALFVDGESTRRVVAFLCEFLNAHLDDAEETIRTESSTLNIGGPQHTIFYAVSQAVFLIFCFRWRDLLDMEGEDGESSVLSAATDISQNEGPSGEGPRKWMPELGILQRTVNSVLNPLRVGTCIDTPNLFQLTACLLGLFIKRCHAIRSSGASYRFHLLLHHSRI